MLLFSLISFNPEDPGFKKIAYEQNIHNYLGYNSRLDEIQAAILNIKMKYIKIFNKKRNMIADYYKKSIQNKAV